MPPYKYEIKYVNKQHSSNMRLIYVYVPDNYVDIEHYVSRMFT